jgi:crotonobetainyl-CoA:carnitine CoA-transferase CaiB-like acyl-CoA transferase
MQRIIHGWTRQHTVDEIIEIATAMRIPVTPIGNGRTTPAIDHLVARGVFATGPGGFLQPRPPYRLERTPLRPFGAAPKLGEHTAQVLQEAETAIPLVSTHRANATAQAASPAPAALPLAGLRIVDLTVFWAGPVATSILGDLGADVIKIESIQRPDGMRFAGAARRDPLWEWSPVFAGNNPSKRAITLNLNSEEGMGLLKRLIATADVVTENFSPRVLEHFGLGWDVIHALNPRAILLRMPAFGLDGPWKDRTGFAMTIEQTSGLAWITGYEDVPLVVRGACDPLGGMHAVFALLLALEHRRRTGEAQLVEVPLLEPALNVAAEQVIEQSAYGTLLQRTGNRGPYAAPQGVYRCAGEEDYVAVAVATDCQWEALRELLGSPEWAHRPALATAAGRRAAHDELDVHIERWTGTMAAEQAAKQLVTVGIPAQRLINGHYLWPNPQLEHRRFFHVMQHPVTGPTRYPGLPMAFSGLPRHLHKSPPPTLGQHNDEILKGELGLSDSELARLREIKIIGERPAFDL